MRRSPPARSMAPATASVSQKAWIEMRGTGRSSAMAAISLSLAGSPDGASS